MRSLYSDSAFGYSSIMKVSIFAKRALLANFLIWTVFIFANISASILDASRAGREVNVEQRILSFLIAFGPWAFVTPLFYMLLDKLRKASGFWFIKVFFVLLIVWLPIAVMFDALSSKIGRNITDKTIWDLYLSMPIWYWTYQLLLFGVAFGSCFALIYYRRSNANKIEALEAKQKNAELELELKALQMKSLQTQLEPHFLFNSLNAISSLVRISERQQALIAIKELSELLRYAVDASNKLFVPFENELEFVKDYISLQSLRFEEKLNVEIHDNRKSNKQECPPFLLQIFVENAIRHGLEKSGEEMHLLVRISDKDEKLVLFVQNSHERSESNSDTLGIGLENLKQRLNILYLDKVEFEVLETSQHYSVEVVMPSVAPE